MTIEDVSDYLQVPVTTIYRWNSHGTGPKYMKVGRYTRYRRADVDRWLEEQQAN